MEICSGALSFSASFNSQRFFDAVRSCTTKPVPQRVTCSRLDQPKDAHTHTHIYFYIHVHTHSRRTTTNKQTLSHTHTFSFFFSTRRQAEGTLCARLQGIFSSAYSPSQDLRFDILLSCAPSIFVPESFTWTEKLGIFSASPLVPQSTTPRMYLFPWRTVCIKKTESPSPQAKRQVVAGGVFFFARTSNTITTKKQILPGNKTNIPQPFACVSENTHTERERDRERPRARVAPPPTFHAYFIALFCTCK